MSVMCWGNGGVGGAGGGRKQVTQQCSGPDPVFFVQKSVLVCGSTNLKKYLCAELVVSVEWYIIQF